MALLTLYHDNPLDIRADLSILIPIKSGTLFKRGAGRNVCVSD